MRVLYIYDLNLKQYENELYSKNFSQKTWAKYIVIIDEMDAYINIVQAKEQPSLQKASTERVTFIQLNNRSIIERLRLLQEIAQYDFILIRMPSKRGLLVGIWAIIKRKKIAVEVVGNFYEALKLHGNIKNKLLARPLHLVMKWIVKNAEVAIYITKNYLQSVYPNNKKSFIVPNAMIEQRPYRENTSESIKIGMIGALNVSYKGHHLLFEALKKVDQLNKPIEISLLGEGKLNKLPAYKNIKVNHIGLISGDELTNWYESLTIYLQPSLTEASGRSIMEAMSYSLPVVASKVGGVPELLDEVALVRRNDSEALASKIIAFINNAQLLQQQGKRNHSFIQSFSIEHNQLARNEMLNYLKKHTSKEATYEKII